MGRRGLPYGKVFFVRLQNNQKGLLEKKAAFGMVLMMLIGGFMEEGCRISDCKIGF